MTFHRRGAFVFSVPQVSAFFVAALNSNETDCAGHSVDCMHSCNRMYIGSCSNNRGLSEIMVGVAMHRSESLMKLMESVSVPKHQTGDECE